MQIIKRIAKEQKESERLQADYTTINSKIASLKAVVEHEESQGVATTSSDETASIAPATTETGEVKSDMSTARLHLNDLITQQETIKQLMMDNYTKLHKFQAEEKDFNSVCVEENSKLTLIIGMCGSANASLQVCMSLTTSDLFVL